MPTIRSLSQSMINKIAAGEVIERPASVVKELVENSVDSGATRIDIALDGGGMDLIRIVDNGCGIESDQLSLALSPHATSKLTDADELFRIFSFGFRGEALASIAEISQLTLKSRTAESGQGFIIQSHGGERSEISSCGMPIGTQIEVRNLFFNTPVRRQYMKSTITEFGHVAEVFIRLAMPQPHIHFTLKHHDRVIHDLPPAEDMLIRIRQLFGDEIVQNLMAIESPPQSLVHVSGFVSHPSQHRPNNRMQYFFLNRRFIRDRALQHALNEAYRGIMISGRFPLAFLQIQLPPDQFDVNVHPTKMEVRFLDSNQIYSGFLSAIREKFLTSDLRGHFRSASPSKETPHDLPPPWEGDEPQDTFEPAAAERKRQEIQDWAAQLSEKAESMRFADNQTGNAPSALFDGEPLLNRERLFDDEPFSDRPRSGTSLSIRHLPERHHSAPHSTALHPGGFPPALPDNKSPLYDTDREDAGRAAAKNSYQECDAGTAGSMVTDRIALSSKGHIVVQMHERYLVMETEKGIAFIDQHALHERILYEQMKERIRSGELESQRFLIPKPIDLSPNEYSCVLEHKNFFKTLGLAAEPFGGNTILLLAFPAVLSKASSEDILLTVIETVLLSGKKSSQDELLDELLHRMACKAAVKAGDRLSPPSMQHLIQLAESEINAHHCPHGRTSTIVFDQTEIDKMFDRT